MNRKKIAIVKFEMKRLQQRITEFEIATGTSCDPECTWYYPKETGAIKRSSMDLTRALADMRKAD